MRRFTWALGRDGELNHPELYNQKQFSRRSSASLRTMKTFIFARSEYRIEQVSFFSVADPEPDP